jgi:hypothetical protein
MTGSVNTKGKAADRCPGYSMHIVFCQWRIVDVTGLLDERGGGRSPKIDKEKKMKTGYGIIAGMIFFVAGCSSTFMMVKNGTGYMLGQQSDEVYRMLCESGDLKKILSEAELRQGPKDDLYKYNCSPERSRDKVKQVFASMAPAERKSLRVAFKSNGYEINAMHC